MSYSAGLASRAYSSVGAQTQVAAATPHRLIQLLMDGALERLATANGQIQRGEVSAKVSSLSKAIAIIDGLRMSLDHSAEQGVSDNLEGLYDYMNRRLLIANINNDCGAVEEVAGLLRELKEAWDAIPEQHRVQSPASAAPM